MIPLLAAILDDSAFDDIVDMSDKIVGAPPNSNDAHQLCDVPYQKYRMPSNAKDERNSRDHVRSE